MSLGTLHCDATERSIVAIGLVKAFKLDIKLVQNSDKPGLLCPALPVFSGPHGYKLQEPISILYYLTKIYTSDSSLLGATLQLQTQVLYYLSWGLCELMKPVANVTRILFRQVPFNKALLESSNEKIDSLVEKLEDRLVNNTYLVGERVTLADLFVASCFYRCFALTLGKEWRSNHPTFMKWFIIVMNTEYLSSPLEDIKYVDLPCKTPKFATKRRKPLHPLEYLGKPTMSLNVWRRVHGTFRKLSEYIKVALPYFWNTFYNANDWSLWKVYREYDVESSNPYSNDMMSFFFERLHFSVKYVHGNARLYCKDGKQYFSGAFIVRGQEAAPVFCCIPGWEEYEYTKLDPQQAEDWRFINITWGPLSLRFDDTWRAFSGISI